MLPFTAADAKVYWRDQLPAVETGRKLVFVACEAGVIAGTVTLDMAWAPNQPHRGDISKMLVHSAFRRRGVGRLLLSALECEARHRGLTLLTFDTVSDSPADLFYRSLGYQFVGRIPGYAMSPSGRMDDTSIFYKTL
ncbi:MAG: GNAT family N-acetyltransferase [Alphaproteobacteria bacterium]|nr:GNAT family N-acetyltransferase [Alphaproteobacteria bacterium]